MKLKLFAITIALIAAISAFKASALSPLPDTNNVWTVVGSSSTNSLADIDRAGNLRVAGRISATAMQTATIGNVTIQTNASVGGTLTLAGTVTVFTAAATVNTNATLPLQGIPVRVNGTNYVIKLYPIVGP